MNILIRADSSSTIGLGHITRDLVLAERFGNNSILFACRDLPGNIIQKIPYPVHLLTTDTPDELIDLIQTNQTQMVVFDHYGIDAEYEEYVKKTTGITIFSLDDTYERHHCDILLNPNLYARPERYEGLVPPSCDLRCGPEHQLIRQEFMTAKQHPAARKGGVLIAMGGSDPENLSMAILECLGKDVRVHVVTTSSNPHLHLLEEYIARHPSIRLHINASNMAQLMNESDYAIITPSSVATEAIYMGLPFIAIQSAPNQTEFVQYLRQNGYRVLERFERSVFNTYLEEIR